MADPNSQANMYELISRHISLHLEADFEKKRLSGYAEHTVEAVEDCVEFVVDTKDLEIAKVYCDGKEAKFSIDEAHPVFGNALRVELGRDVAQGEKLKVKIEYNTTPNSTAIQWLSPSQTADKVHPYLFTQCQAIHARSMLPCQDAPQVKASYDATVIVPAPLVAVMSAVGVGEPEEKDNKRTFKFKQDVPICSYLIALAIGALESREIGPRSKVWSEKSMVEAAAYEFAQTEEFLKVGEDLFGPYVWGRYDILLLPPSFPYGGMENPCLTFVTPTLLSGDRSNADVIAHEIMHSWTGNLVTNLTWEHFWLNEGFTVFGERKIQGRLHGEQERHFSAIIGWKALVNSVELYGEDSPFTALVPDLQGIDPDDAFSSIPYEKGFNFLFYLETLVGIENFEKFTRDYIEKFKYKCVTSEDFGNFFLSYFSGKEGIDLSVVDWETWFNSAGMPPVEPKFDTTLSAASQELAQKWLDGGKDAKAEDIASFSAGQIVVFLDTLVSAPNPLSIDSLQRMEELYKLTSSKNSEIRFRWYQLCIRAEQDTIFPHVVQFLKEQGRMKFVRPLYRSLFKSEKGKALAVTTFKELRDTYHNIASKMVAKDLEVN